MLKNKHGWQPLSQPLESINRSINLLVQSKALKSLLLGFRVIIFQFFFFLGGVYLGRDLIRQDPAGHSLPRPVPAKAQPVSDTEMGQSLSRRSNVVILPEVLSSGIVA